MILSQHPKTGAGKERKEKMTNLVLEDGELEAAMDLIEPKDRLEKVVIQTLMQHK